MIKSTNFVGPFYQTTKNRPTFVCHLTDFIDRYFGNKFSSRTRSKIGRFYRSSVIGLKQTNFIYLWRLVVIIRTVH